jgi:hypothetical protein
VIRAGAMTLGACALAAVPRIAAAQDVTAEPEQRYDVSGEVRVREEVRTNGYSGPTPDGDSDVELAHMRSRVRLDVAIDPGVAVVLELQDVRVLGEQGSTTADSEGVDLKRGAILLSELGGQPLSVELGRYVMKYGSERLIGALEWVDQGRTYDGARLSFAPAGWFVDGFATRIREGMAADGDLGLIGAYGGVSIAPWLDTEVYALGLFDRRDDDTMPESTYATLGARAAVNHGGVDATAEAAVQLGELDDSDLRGAGVAATAGYTAPVPWSPRLGVELDYATGDDPATATNERFQTLLPTNHMHYGYADLAAWSNLVAARAGVSAQPHPTLRVSLDAHYLRLARGDDAWISATGAVIRPGMAGAGAHLGNEIDATVWWKPHRAFSMLAGVAYFAPGAFVRDTGADPGTSFAYAQAGAQF